MIRSWRKWPLNTNKNQNLSQKFYVVIVTLQTVWNSMVSEKYWIKHKIVSSFEVLAVLLEVSFSWLPLEKSIITALLCDLLLKSPILRYLPGCKSLRWRKNNRFIGKRIGSRACSKRTFRLVPRSVFDQVRKFELGVEMRRIRHFAIRKCKLAYD